MQRSPIAYGQPIPKAVRQAVLGESGHKCANPWCYQFARDVHHIKPRETGGDNHPRNLIALCQICHQAFHRGVLGARSIERWKLAIADGTMEALGVRLVGWQDFDRAEKRKLWTAFRLGRLGGITAICVAKFEAATDPQQVVSYGLVLGEVNFAKRNFSETDRIIARVQQAIDQLFGSRGYGFGVRALVRLYLLQARVESARDPSLLSLSYYKRAAAIAESDRFQGWQEHFLAARAEAIVSEIKRCGNPSAWSIDVVELRRVIDDAVTTRLVRSQAAAFNLIGKGAIAQAYIMGERGSASALNNLVKPVIEPLRRARYVRGYVLRQVNLADLLSRYSPREWQKREEIQNQRHDLYKSALAAATANGTVPFSHSIIPEQVDRIAEQIRQIELGPKTS